MGEAELLLPSEHSQFPMSWSPDGQVLAFQEFNTETADDIWMLGKDGEPQPLSLRVFVNGPRVFSRRAFLAYVSNESGRHEVYVQPYPATGRGGRFDRWRHGAPLVSRRSDALLSQGDRVMAVALETSAEFCAGKPRQLFEGPFEAHIFPNYDISPDGDRFIMIVRTRRGERNPRCPHWFRELRRLVPTNN